MHFRAFCWLFLLTVTSALFVSCGPKEVKGPGTRKDLTKVTGSITVNGQPAAGIKITAMPIGGDVDNPHGGQAMSNEKGEFQFTTYKNNDGLPAGDYILVITWGEFSALHRTMTGDKFGGKYAKADANKK